MPLQLYRSILRLHKQLPPDLKFLGNQYVKSEFRRHKDSKPEFVNGFIAEWKNYRDSLEAQVRNRHKVGSKLDELDAFSPEQLGQLLELKQATKEIK